MRLHPLNNDIIYANKSNSKHRTWFIRKKSTSASNRYFMSGMSKNVIRSEKIISRMTASACSSGSQILRFRPQTNDLVTSFLLNKSESKHRTWSIRKSSTSSTNRYFMSGSRNPAPDPRSRSSILHRQRTLPPTLEYLQWVEHFIGQTL